MRYRSLASGAVLLAVILGSQGASQVSETKTIHYHGIRPTDPDGRDGLRNPERGFRIETLIAEPPGGASWGPAAHLKGKVSEGYSDGWWLADMARYEQHGLTMAQTYCYLDEYVGGPIPQEKLDWLRSSLSLLRQNGYKALLRFAYERTMSPPTGPTMDDIRRHAAQLRPIVREYADVVFVLQAGMVGAWGEWHSSANALESDHANLAEIVATILDLVPLDRMTQIRVPKYKRWALGHHEALSAEAAYSGTPASRVGHHNDGFLAGTTDGGTWPEPPHHANPGNPEYDIMTAESPYVPIDGELFWGDQGGKIEGLRAAESLRRHHYTTFSLAHSYSEREGKPYSIDDWMATEITEEQLRERRLPVSDGYFDGTTRAQFEYIRDHLGYRIELQEATLPTRLTPGSEAPVAVTLINRGFSTIHNPRPVVLALIDNEDNVVAQTVTDANPRTWQPFEPGDESYMPLTHVASGTLSVPSDLADGEYRLGLWMPAPREAIRLDPRYAVRVANGDVAWSARLGINILGTIRVDPHRHPM